MRHACHLRVAADIVAEEDYARCRDAVTPPCRHVYARCFSLFRFRLPYAFAAPLIAAALFDDA